MYCTWQAPYVWDAVKNILISEGNSVTVVELPGHGSDQTVPSALTLNSYRDKVSADSDLRGILMF